MKYLKLFDTHSNYETFAGDTLNPMIKPNVSHCVSENEVHYNPLKYDYSKDYLTIESLEDNNQICWEATGNSSRKTISASTDNGQTWTAFTASYDAGSPEYVETKIATLNAGEKVLVKGENAAYYASNYASKFVITKNVNISGNIMSLIHGDLFENNNTLTESYCFTILFRACNVVSAENLILPATTLTEGCYQSMFYNCTSLTVAPELPATALAAWCYSYMFSNCTSLTKVATVPSSVKTVGADYCCGMYCQATNIPQSQDYSSYAYVCNCNEK